MFTGTNKHWCVHNNLARTTRALVVVSHSTNIAQSCSQIKFNVGGGGFAQLSRLSIQTVTSPDLTCKFAVQAAVLHNSQCMGFWFCSILFLLLLLVSMPAARLPDPNFCVVAASLGVAAKCSFFFQLFQLWLLLLQLLPVAHMSTGNSAAAVLNSCLVFD